MQYQEDNFDPCCLNFENQPYGPNSMKYYAYDDSQLSYDPFGYYQPKSVYLAESENGIPFFEDYPQNYY